MKYRVLIFLVILTIFTGCNKNKLTCEKNKKNAGYDYNEKYEFMYDKDGNELKKIKLFIKATYNEYYTEEEIDEEYHDVVSYCSVFDLADEKLITCNAKRDDNVVSVNAVIEAEKIDDESFEQIMYVTKEEISNRKEAKKMLQNVGYTCKWLKSGLLFFWY